MNPKTKAKEIDRLIRAFEHQAGNFHNLTLSLEYIKRGQTSYSRPIKNKHHGIFLWQFFGVLKNKDDTEAFAQSIEGKNLQWGVPNAELTCIAIIEGEAFETFIIMARRAGSIFSDDEAYKFKTRMTSEITEAERAKDPDGKVLVSTNDNPLAIWLNYLLYYISKSHPDRERSRTIEPDPFSLSLLALEDFQLQGETTKMNQTFSKLSEIKFKVALSFPGEKRDYVEQVANSLKSALSENSVFYDFDYQAHLCHPNADIILQNIYHRQSQLIVIFLCKEYSEKQWCGLELRAIRDLIKQKQGHKLIIVRFDTEEVYGFFSIDGYLDAQKFSPSEISKFILENL